MAMVFLMEEEIELERFEKWRRTRSYISLL
jgi:hypothetical protein